MEYLISLFTLQKEKAGNHPAQTFAIRSVYPDELLRQGEILLCVVEADAFNDVL